MGHWQHGIVWVLLGIVPIAGFIFSTIPNLLQNTFYRTYAKSLDLQGGERVVDFGCGKGLLSKQIAELLPQGHLTCIDINIHAIASAKKRLKSFCNIDIKNEDIRNLPKPAQTYDVVVTQFVLHDITPMDRV